MARVMYCNAVRQYDTRIIVISAVVSAGVKKNYRIRAVVVVLVKAKLWDRPATGLQ